MTDFGASMEDDLCKLCDLSEDGITDLLERRYCSGDIYTRSGLVLLAINPYERMDIYGRSVMQAYFNRLGSATPHVYDIAESSYRDFKVHGDQTIVISGESGSGKTESAKLVISYLLRRAGGDGGIERKVDAANTILEAFGNAQTRLNENSSRFGKRTKLTMEERVAGVEIETYLLEKGRVTHQGDGERNFHIFYQLCGFKSLDVKNDFIDTLEAGQSKDRNVLASEYSKVIGAMREVGIENIEELENSLLGILHLGFVRLSGNGDLGVIRDEHFREFCSIYDLEEDLVERYLTRYSIQVRGERIEVFNTAQQAITIRNSIARLLYSSIFEYVTRCINRCLGGGGKASISVLDIFGFEVFKDNGLDQFCINWTNEKIQDEFVKRMFRDKQEMYREEGVEWDDVEYSGSSRCISEFERPCGLVDLINEESSNAWGSAKNLGMKIRNYMKESVRMKGDEVMVVRHYAGDVEYRLFSFVEKNRERGDLGMFRNGFISHDRSREGLIKYFRDSMDRLFHAMNMSQTKYIRCIRPNREKMPRMFSRPLVLKQLLECGVLETVEMGKRCFPQEICRERFENRYRVLDNVFWMVTVKEGRTKYFMDNESMEILEIRRQLAYEECSRVIRTALRSYMCRSLVEKKRRIMFVSQDKDESAGEGGETICMAEDSIDGLQEDREQEVVSRHGVKDELSLACVSISDPYETIRELEARIETYKRFCKMPCRNCRSLELKYKFQSEALRKKNAVELELEKYKARVEYLEKRLREREEDDDSQVSVSFTNSYNVFSCLIQLYLEFVPAFSLDGEVPRPEILGFAHSAFYAVNKLGRGAVESTRCMVEEIGSKLHVFERNIHKVAFVLSNLVEYRGILCGKGAGSVDELEDLVLVLFRHLCELQKSSLLEVLPHAVLEHQQLSKFRCSEGYLKKIFRPPSISKLVHLLEYFYYQMTYYHLPEQYVLESVNHMLKTINVSVFNGLLIKKSFLSFNRGVQINYNVNEIDKFCRSIDYIEGMLNLAQTTSAIRLINLVEARAAADVILDECSILSCVQINEIVSKFDNPMAYSFGEDSRHSKFLPDPTVSLPLYEGESQHSFVCPRYLPSESLLSIFKSIR